jgi:hypothetical protein
MHLYHTAQCEKFNALLCYFRIRGGLSDPIPKGLIGSGHCKFDPFLGVCTKQDATRSLAALRKTAKDKELAALLSGEHDSRSCFLEVNPQVSSSCWTPAGWLQMKMGNFTANEVYCWALRLEFVMP